MALALVTESRRNIFLTGKAGTGKTTFLKYVREHCQKQIAVVAPTGVAAINAGGATIHSFFQLPLSPFIPEARGFTENKVMNKHSLLGRMRINKEKRKIFQQLELLVIDEISMVRADTMDAIDTILRYFRNRSHEPFGGVQVLLIGDMFQLPPIIPDAEWNLLSQFYKSQYFFESRVIQQFPPAYIQFEKIYRQADAQFIDLLNQVRHSTLTADMLGLLNSRFNAHFPLSEHDGYVYLTTHNYQADHVNSTQLGKLAGKIFSFKAEVKGEFNEKSYPADELLQLKIGAQVMFLRNDKEKRFFNGKIGTVASITENSIFVQCSNEEHAIEVGTEVWENVRYSLDRSSQSLEEEMVGSFSQYPLRLAWAITIHKSQGLTFEKVVIDAGQAFAPGQVYVALSRCTTLEGIILKSKIAPASLKVDERITNFSKNSVADDQLKEDLIRARKEYEGNILLNLFDFTTIVNECAELRNTIKDNQAAFNKAALEWIDNLQNKILASQSVAQKFKTQLSKFFDPSSVNSQALQQRLMAASSYFAGQADEMMQLIKTSPAQTDGRQHAKVYNESAKEMFNLLAEKKHLLDCCRTGFSIGNYQQQKKSFSVPAFSLNAYGTSSEQKNTESPHPQLQRKLRDLRNKICDQKNLPIYYVASGKSIDEMAEYLPQNLDELVKLSGFGKAKAKLYGQQFLEIITGYCRDHELGSLVHKKRPKRERKGGAGPDEDTRSATYRLYKDGKPIAEIAKLRNLAVSTVESHLEFLVRKGVIAVHEIVKPETLNLIESSLENFEGGSITPIKQKLGDAVSFGEIRIAIAAKDWERQEKVANSAG
ncbi:MAG TPA: helix-turn-helix domain-containing protein [Parafilimonas sp.]|nr:helix-turn-helix domain-containing protein [Parafilimonas sp.]